MTRLVALERAELEPVAVGASEVAAVLGCDPWTTPLQLYRRKLGLDDPPADREAFRIGRALEGPVVAIARERIPLPIRRNRRTFVSTSAPFMFATPDAFVGRDRLLEVKVVGRRAPGWTDDEDGDPVPCHVRMQVQAQLAVTGRDLGYVAALLGSEVRVIGLERDDEAVATILDAVGRFVVEHLGRRTPPDPLTYDERWADAIGRASAGVGEALAGTVAQQLGDELLEVRAQVAQLEDRERDIRVELADEVAALGVAKLVGTGWTATVGSRRGSVDWSRLGDTLAIPAEVLEAYRAPDSATFTVRSSKR